MSACSAQALTNSGGTYTATCTTSSLPTGSLTITADYGGDTDYATSKGTLSGAQVVRFATGYWTVAANGAVTALGAPSYGSAASLHLNQPGTAWPARLRRSCPQPA